MAVPPTVSNRKDSAQSHFIPSKKGDQLAEPAGRGMQLIGLRVIPKLSARLADLKLC